MKDLCNPYVFPGTLVQKRFMIGDLYAMQKTNAMQ